MNNNVLLLGGTSEAYALATALTQQPHWHVVTSLAGRTTDPRLPAGECRIGGFGGADGLAVYLRERHIRAVIDATHPFAARMGWNAHAGCHAAAVPLLRLERPAWVAEPADHWLPVADWTQAVAALNTSAARRVLLAVGRQELLPFSALTSHWFLIRVVTPPDPMPPFAAYELVCARGPFDLASERALLTTHAIEAIVCKNSGGEATAAKLIAARERQIPVIMYQRPLRPAVPAVATVAAAAAWLTAL